MSEELVSAREWVKKQGLGFPATQKVFEHDLKEAYKAGFEEGLALFNLPKGYKMVIVKEKA